MFSSESENFKRYTHFPKQIYITASRLGTDKTMIPMSISGDFEQIKLSPTIVHDYSEQTKILQTNTQHWG